MRHWLFALLIGYVTVSTPHPARRTRVRWVGQAENHARLGMGMTVGVTIPNPGSACSHTTRRITPEGKSECSYEACVFTAAALTRK